MKKIIKLMALALCCAIALSFAGLFSGCGGQTQKVGILMPSAKEQRWTQDSDNLKRQLQAKGYMVEIKNAEDSADVQVSQIDAMVDDGFNVLVICAHDSTKLTQVLQKAANKGVKIIAYDRLIMNSPNVDYYVTFNNFEVGRLQGEYIETALNLKTAKAEDRSYNIELFAGAATDNNAIFFFDGAMSVLEQYLGNGVLKVPSGETERAVVAEAGWTYPLAKARMDRLLTENYADGTELHAVLSPNDGIAQVLITSFKAAGFTDMPILTGQDSEKESVKKIIADEQAMTVFKDTRALADRTFKMVEDILLGNTPETNDAKTYHNGEKIVPTYMCKPVGVTKTNYKEILIDSGYYELSDLQ
ncbi:MAG: sugar-binding protein [Firmicutes bacterium]|nr:sugar-binding protein [Bacillota bacterium]